VNDLLALAVKAYGGLDRWNQLRSVRVAMSVTGGIWYVKSVPNVLQDIIVEADLHEEKLSIHYLDQKRRTTFEPFVVVSESDNGTILERRENPRASFEGQTRETPWDKIQVAYFASEAFWTYLTTPFLYTYPGFVTEELAPWHENGEVWRPLKVTFPDNITSHTREQVSYFGQDGLLRRHEYTVDILGGATGENYAFDYKEYDGIMVGTKRRVYAYDENKKMVPEPLLVAIDMKQVTFR
jgi:hypothetical protein